MFEGAQGKMSLLEAATGKRIREFEGAEQIEVVAFSPDSKMLASGLGTFDVNLWHVDTGRIYKRIKTGHRSFINTIQFSKDGRKLLTANQDSWSRIIDLDSGTSVFDVGSGGAFPMQCACFSADEKRVITGDGWGHVRVWDAATSKELVPLEPHIGPVLSMAYDAEAGRLFTFAVDGYICWEARSGERKSFISLPLHTRGVVSPNRNKALVQNGRNGTPMRLLDLSSGKEIRSFNAAGILHQICLIGEGPKALSVGEEGDILLWDYRQEAPIASLKGHPGPVSCVTASEDGLWALSGGSDGKNKDFTVRLWNLTTLKEECRFASHTDHLQCVAFSPSGKWAASSANDKTVRVYRVSGADSEEMRTLQKHEWAVRAVCFSPSGDTLASAGDDGKVILWNPATGASRKTWQFPGPVYSLFFTPDGRHLVTGNKNGTAFIIRFQEPL